MMMMTMAMMMYHEGNKYLSGWTIKQARALVLVLNCGVRPIGVCNLLLTGFVRASEDLRANQSGLIFSVHQ